MERHLDHDLDRIRQELLRMGGLVEEMIGGAMQALIDRDAEHANVVIATDNEVDSLEKEIDDRCHTVLGLQQPTASDLRFLVSVMKIATSVHQGV